LKAPGVKKALGVPEIPKQPVVTAPRPSIDLYTALKQTLKQAKTASQQSTSLPIEPTKVTNQITSSSSSSTINQRLRNLEKQVKGRKKNKKSFGKVTPEQKAEAKYSLATYSWEDFLHSSGESKQFDLPERTKSDICTIMYTSGTTGDPKGVMISNCSIVTLIAGVKHLVESVNEELTEKDAYLSYLPLAHIFDRVIEEFFISRGALMGFCRGDVKLLVDDIGELKSSIFCAVPRVLDRVHSAQCIICSETVITSVHHQVYYRRFLGEANCLRRCLMWHTQLHSFFKFAYVKQIIVSAEFHIKLYNGAFDYGCWLLFYIIPFMESVISSTQINSGLGGNVRLILSSAAPLSDHVEEFLRGVACCHLPQGYGLTETCAGTFVSLPNELSMLGTVGPPVPNVDRCLESVPEMGYDALASIPRGEICVRGDPIFRWQPNGSMKIIDRKKNIFKLSQGEYVAVENLDNVFGLESVIDSIWIYGNSFESFLVAVVNPKKQALESWAAENGVHGGSNSIRQNPKAKRVRSRGALKDWKREKGFEFIKAAHIDPVPFDMERDPLTPTYKKKRSQLL
ncbi:hypothetical protein Goshw_018467, partial [Gossypium schwendimanii]|nr:hypothetical protein [Gossypium schwendimanii]